MHTAKFSHEPPTSKPVCIPDCYNILVDSCPEVFHSGFSEQLNQDNVKLAPHEWEEEYDSDYDAEDDAEVLLKFYDDVDATHFSRRAALLKLPSRTQISTRRILSMSKQPSCLRRRAERR